MAQLEHVNITVSNPEKSAELYCDLFGWEVRWRGKSQYGGTTIHIGSGTSYLAIWAAEDQDLDKAKEHLKGLPLNHIGIIVDNLDKTEQKIRGKGLKTFSHGDYEPGRRFYFLDPDGIEIEVISYKKSINCVLGHLRWR